MPTRSSQRGEKWRSTSSRKVGTDSAPGEPKTRWEHMTDAPAVGVGVIRRDGQPAQVAYGRQDGHLDVTEVDLSGKPRLNQADNGIFILVEVNEERCDECGSDENEEKK